MKEADYSEFIGIPYSQQDCWGLVKLFYKKIFDIELKAYYEQRPNDRSITMNMIYSHSGEFAEVKEPKLGDIIVFKMFGIPCHIGIYINQLEFLHTNETHDSVMDRLPRWNKQIVAIYRVKQNA